MSARPIKPILKIVKRDPAPKPTNSATTVPFQYSCSEETMYRYQWFNLSVSRQSSSSSLSVREFEILTKTSCGYCNRNTIAGNKLQRLNHNSSHDLGNLINVCKICQELKGSFNHEEFMEIVKHILSGSANKWAPEEFMYLKGFVDYPSFIDWHAEKGLNLETTEKQYQELLKCNCQVCKTPRPSDTYCLVNWEKEAQETGKYVTCCFTCTRLKGSLNINGLLSIINIINPIPNILSHEQIQELIKCEDSLLGEINKTQPIQVTKYQHIHDNQDYYRDQIWTGNASDFTKVIPKLQFIYHDRELYDKFLWYKTQIARQNHQKSKYGQRAIYCFLTDEVTGKYLGIISLLNDPKNISADIKNYLLPKALGNLHCVYEVTTSYAFDDFRLLGGNDILRGILLTRELSSYIYNFYLDRYVPSETSKCEIAQCPLPLLFISHDDQLDTGIIPQICVKKSINIYQNYADLCTAYLNKLGHHISCREQGLEMSLKTLCVPDFRTDSIVLFPIYPETLDLLKQEDIHQFFIQPNINVEQDYLSRLPTIKNIVTIPVHSQVRSPVQSPVQSSATIGNSENTSIVPFLIELGLIDIDYNDLCRRSKTYEFYKPDAGVESWRPVPLFLVSYHEGYYASDKGRLRLEDEIVLPTFLSQNRYAKYKVLMLDGRPHYYHRIVWWTFNPNTPLYSRILYHTYKTDINWYLDCSIDKLFVSTSSNWDYSGIELDRKPLPKQHPVYGNYTINSWLPLRGHLTRDGNDIITEYKDHQIMLLDQELPCAIRRKEGDWIKIFDGLRDPSVALTQNKVTDNYRLTHVILASAFPQVAVKKEADHIDNDRFNHHIGNLQWLTSLENLLKNQLNTSKKPRNGNEVTVTDKFGYGEIFRSASEAAKAIYFMTKDLYEGTVQSVRGKVYELVSLNSSDIRKTVRGFRVERTQSMDDLPDEDWNPYVQDPMYLVSNKGRVIGKHNVLLRLSRCRNGPYSSVNIGGKYVYVHHVMWQTYHGKLPEKPLVILHDDLAPKDKQYYYRNWAEDLSSGTRSTNNKQYNEALRFKKYKKEHFSKNDRDPLETRSVFINFMEPPAHIKTLMPADPPPARYPAIGQYLCPLFRGIVDSNKYEPGTPMGVPLVDAVIEKLETYFRKDEFDYNNFWYKLQRLREIAVKPSKITVQISYPMMSFRKEDARVLCNLHERSITFELHESELGADNYFSSIQTPVKRTLQSVMDNLPSYQSSVLLDHIYDGVADIQPSINEDEGEIDFNSIVYVSVLSREYIYNSSYQKDILVPVVTKRPEFDDFYNAVCRYLLKPNRMYIKLSAFNESCTIQLFDTQCNLERILALEDQTVLYESFHSLLPEYHKNFVATMLPKLENNTKVTISVQDGYCDYEDVGSYYNL